VPKIITYDQLREYGIHLSRRALHEAEKKGTFPRRVKISEARIGWIEDEIRAHIEKKIRERR
jgi:predicted DNA-binding transcriptional regulator AlpA